MEKKKPEIRDKHLGVVVEPSFHKELTAIAASRHLPLSTFVYVILTEWLEKHKAEATEKGSGT